MDCVVLGCGLPSTVCRGGGAVYVADDDGGGEHGHLVVCLCQGLEEGFDRIAKGEVAVDDVELPSVPHNFVDAQPSWDAEVPDEVDVHARLGIQGGPLVPMAFLCPLVRGIYGGGFRMVIALKALLPEDERVGNTVRPMCHRELLEGGGGVLGVCDGQLVDGSLGVRGPRLWGPSSPALVREENGGPRAFCLVVGA